MRNKTILLLLSLKSFIAVGMSMNWIKKPRPDLLYFRLVVCAVKVTEGQNCALSVVAAQIQALQPFLSSLIGNWRLYGRSGRKLFHLTATAFRKSSSRFTRRAFFSSEECLGADGSGGRFLKRSLPDTI